MTEPQRAKTTGTRPFIAPRSLAWVGGLVGDYQGPGQASWRRRWFYWAPKLEEFSSFRRG